VNTRLRGGVARYPSKFASFGELGWVDPKREPAEPLPYCSVVGALGDRTDKKGFRHCARKPMNPLAQNFGIRWSARYTF
jgi:hypothetical protein